MSLRKSSDTIPSPEKTLRRLFLTVFIRGQSSRGISKQTVAKSFHQKMALMYLVYGAFGLTSLAVLRQSVLIISVALHSLTFLALGMFISGSAGEALFNKEESEILLHRPVTSEMLLRAKAAVLVQIALSVSVALNAVGLIVGLSASDGNMLFPLVHLVSMALEALFSVGVVVLLYELCLRWLGREKLESIMTTLQVLLIVCITAGSQILPRAIGRTGISGASLDAWWLKILPPAWFASLDDAVAGHSRLSWTLGGCAVVVTGVLLWLAFSKLANVYESGVQSLGESAQTGAKASGKFRARKRLSEVPPLSWLLRTPVSRVGFQLVSAYMTRDRDTKLRLYPGVAPMMVMPIVLLLSGKSMAQGPTDSAFAHGMNSFFVAMAATYVCLVPLTALNLLKFSQQYRATDVFVAAPIEGPAPLLQGARVAAVLYLTLPILGAFVAFFVATQGAAALAFVFAGVLALPVYAMIPGILPNAAPLSNPIEEAKSLNSMPIMMTSIFASFGIAGGAAAASHFGVLPLFLVLEASASAGLCWILYRMTLRQGWRVYD